MINHRFLRASPKALSSEGLSELIRWYYPVKRGFAIFLNPKAMLGRDKANQDFLNRQQWVDKLFLEVLVNHVLADIDLP